jgi:D-arabinose 1-dehydrogenase-like Zn-dependent alcohol dehydrogenase
MLSYPDDEVLLKVKACGVCGSDLSTAASEAKEMCLASCRRP